MSFKADIARELANRVKAGDGLAMDFANRMQRARDQGFDTDTIYTHESPSADVIEEIDTGGKFGGIFSLPNDRAGYYDDKHDFILNPEKIAGDDELYNADPELVQKAIDDNLNFLKDDYSAEDMHEWIASFDNIPSDVVENDYAEIQKARAQLARESGYSAVTQPDEFDDTVQLLGGDGLRSVDAAFDPAKKGDSNLLASVGAGAVAGGGLLAGMSPRDAQASPSTLSELIAMKGEPLSRSAISSAKYPVLGDVARVAGSVETPIGRPFGGLADYLQKINYDDDIGYLDRLGAIPDPFDISKIFKD